MDGASSSSSTPSLSDLFQRTKRMLMQTRNGIEKLERLESSLYTSSPSPYAVGLGSSDLAVSIRRDLGQIYQLSGEMNRILSSIPAKGQRDLWKRKLELVGDEVNSLKDSLDKLLLRQEKQMMEVKERSELLQRRNGNSAHIVQVFDEEAQAMQSAHNSNMILEEAYETGVAVLSKYAEQRERLKKAQRKAFDILNTLGLSNSVLKLVERRHRVDKWIAYAGMITTIVVVYAFWRWTH